MCYSVCNKLGTVVFNLDIPLPTAGGTWKCTAKCNPLAQFEVDTVLECKSYFEKPLRDCVCCPCVMMTVLAHIIPKFVVLMSDVQCKGHSVLCYDDSECKSRQRILRLASCHYPLLRGFLNNIYLARNKHLIILMMKLSPKEISNS